MKQFFLSILTLVICLTTLGAKKDKDKCNTVEDIIKSTLSAIETRDTAAYVSLASVDVMLATLKADMATDSTKKKMYETLSQNPEKITSWFKYNFKRFLESMDFQMHNQKLTIKFLDYKIVGQETISPKSTHYTLNVRFDINQKIKYVLLYVTKIKKCYYVFEPLGFTFNDF